jgi:DNA-binding transcriptional LysR family regulator
MATAASRRERDKMDLWRLQIFCEVVEMKSFSKAASNVYLSQPTVSSHIKDLEDHFQCKLIDRLGREVAPTKAGELLYRHAKKMIALKDDMEKSLAEFQGILKGNLTIGGSTIPGCYILPSLLGRFKEVYPDILVTLIEKDTAGVLEDVIAGHVELGIVGAKTRDPRLRQNKIMDDEMFVVIPKQHKWAKKKAVTVSELVDEPFIAREPGSGTRKSIEQALNRTGNWRERQNVVAEMGSTEAIRQAVKAGVGISIMSKCAIADDVAAGLLKKVRISKVPLRRAFFLVTHKQRTRSPLCQAFIHFLNQERKL